MGNRKLGGDPSRLWTEVIEESTITFTPSKLLNKITPFH